MEKMQRAFLSGEPKLNPRHRDSWFMPPTEFKELKGYLRKRAKNKRWQKRYFEANDHYLTYYKSKTSERLLACIDLRQVTRIDLGNATPECSPGEFCIELAGRIYVMKAHNDDEAKTWVEGLRLRSKQPIQDTSSPADQNDQRKHRASSASSTSTSASEPKPAEEVQNAENVIEKQEMSTEKLGCWHCFGWCK